MDGIIVSSEGPEIFRSSERTSSIPEIVSVQGDYFPASCTGIYNPSPKQTWDMSTVHGGQGTIGGRSANWLWQCLLREPSNSPQRETVTSRCQNKPLIGLYIPQKQTLHSCHPLSRALLFFLHFHSWVFKSPVNKGIPPICSHSFKHLHQLSMFLKLVSASTLTQKPHAEHLHVRWAGRDAAVGEGSTSRHVIAQDLPKREGLQGTRVFHFESDRQLWKRRGRDNKTEMGRSSGTKQSVLHGLQGLCIFERIAIEVISAKSCFSSST